MSDPSLGHRVLSAVAIIAIGAILVGPRFRTIGGDAVFDWLSVQGLSDGFPYGTPMGRLAEHHGLDFPVPPGFPARDAWIHPRSPGLLMLLTPLRLFGVEAVSDWSRVIAGLTWFVLPIFMIPLLGLRLSTLALAGAVLATASAPVLMLLEFGPHLGLVALLIAVSWYLSLERDSATAGVLVGLTAIARPTFGLLIFGLLLARRPRSALAATLTWLGVEGLGFVVMDVDPAHFLKVTATATQQWLAGPTNGSLASLVSGFLGSQGSVVLGLIATLGLFGVVYARHRRAPISMAGWMTTGTVGALVASPVLWEQYLLVLVIPFAWAVQRLPVRRLWIVAISVGLTQVGLLVVRRLAPDGVFRGVLIAVAAAVLIVPIFHVALSGTQSGPDPVSLNAVSEPK